jgi:hypothetical protein
MSRPAARTWLATARQVRIVLQRDGDRLVRVAGSRGSVGGGSRSSGSSPMMRRKPSSLLRSRPLRRRERALRQRQPRLGLGDVGAGEVAHLEPVARRLQIGLQHPHLVLVQATIERSRMTSM